MSEPKDAELRIYCICGQKMRVQADMYGKPGRCVACRQKIRIPTKEELPPGITELYLKDHPEYLRKKSSREKSEPISETTSDEEQVLSDFSGVYSLPFDSLEILQILICAEYKAQRYLQAIRQKKPIGKESKTDLLEILSKIRRMRASLDDKIKNRRSEVLEQLKQVEKELGKIVVSFRTGDIEFKYYWKTVVPLRIRRERLMWRRKNLEGWLSTVSPELAGGYIDTDFSKLPDKVPDIVFPLEEEDKNISVLSLLIKEIQKYIDLRADVEHKYAEWRKMVEEGRVNPEVGEKGLAEWDARLKIIQSAISFYRERLEQLVADCELDLESIEKNINRIDKQKEAHIIDINKARELQEELFQARLDLIHTKDTARRAISANSRFDIPSLQGTFIARIGPDRGQIEIGADSWIAWFCSALLIMLIMIPMTQSQGLVSTEILVMMIIGLFISAILLALVGSIPYRKWRGIGLSILWVSYVFLFTLHINFAWYSVTPYGGDLRASPHGFFAFRVVSVYILLGLIGVAVWVSLYKDKRFRWIPLLSTIFTLLEVAIISTDCFGALQGNAILGAAGRTEYIASTGNYRVEINIHNKGMRSVWLGNDIRYVPAPVYVNVIMEGNEKQNFMPYEVTTETFSSQPIALVFNKEGGRIGPTKSITLFYQLAPGVYIFRLEGKGNYYQPKQIRLVLPEQKKENVPPQKEENPVIENNKEKVIEKNEENNTRIENNTVTDSATAEQSIFMELQNTSETALRFLQEGEVLVFFHGFAKVVDKTEGNNSSPQFRVSLYTKDKKTMEQFFRLGDKIVGDWILSEFSPQRETITLNFKGQLFVATVGKYYKLKL
ncbi:MAG: hypothetical protein ACP5UA_05310 [Candidatus Hydrogenedens sp.]